MKDDHKLDQLFREGLANHPTPAPEYIWDGIEARRFGAKAAKNTNKYWLFLLLLFISVGGYGTWMYLSVDNDQRTLHQKQTVYNTATNKLSSNNKSVSEANSSELSQDKATSIGSAINSSNNDQNKSLTPSITTKTKKESTKQAKATKEKNKINTKNSAPIAGINNNVKESLNQTNSSELSERLGNFKVRTSSPSNTVLASANYQGQKSVPSRSSTLDKYKLHYEIASLHSIRKSNLREELLDDKFTLEKKRVKKRVAEECYSFLPSRHKGLTFEAYYGPDYNVRTLTEKSVSSSTSENFGHFVARDTSESRWYSHSAGIRLNYYLKGGLHLKTGVNLTRISERFDYREDEGRTILNSVVIDTIYYPNDSIRYVYADNEVLQVGERSVVTHVKHRFIDIPILLGYELELPNRFSFSLTGGVLLNLLYLKKGNMIGPDTSLPTPYSDYNNSESPFFTRRAALSAYASFISYYKLQSNIHLMLEPSVRHYLKPLTKSSYQLEQRYSSFGLKLGMRYVF